MTKDDNDIATIDYSPEYLTSQKALNAMAKMSTLEKARILDFFFNMRDFERNGIIKTITYYTEEYQKNKEMEKLK